MLKQPLNFKTTFSRFGSRKSLKRNLRGFGNTAHSSFLNRHVQGLAPDSVLKLHSNFKPTFDAPLHHARSLISLVCYVFYFWFQLMPVCTAQFGQADLFKTEAHTETPMTQLGRANVSSAIINHIYPTPKPNDATRTRRRIKRN